MKLKNVETLFIECAKYTKACGKQSILETKPVCRIDISKLGACLQNGKIRFQTEEAALNYSKKACMKTANFQPTQQFEIAIVREGDTILGQVNGTQTNVDLSNLDTFSYENRKLRTSKPKTVSVEHYHPDLYGKGKTNPLSIGVYGGDAGILARPGIRSITAYNSLGEYNKAEALPNFNQKLLWTFAQKYKDLIMREAVTKEQFERYSLLKAIKNLASETDFKMSKKSKKELVNLQSEVNNLCRKYQETPEFARVTHNFWLENSENFGMKYTTNMTFS